MSRIDRKKAEEMFGHSKDQEGKIQELAKKGKWDKLKKYLDGTKEEQIALAKACKESGCDDSVNLLIHLLDFATDEEILTEALYSLGEVGTDHAVSQIQLLLNKTEKGNEKLYNTILETLHKLRGKR